LPAWRDILRNRNERNATSHGDGCVSQVQSQAGGALSHPQRADGADASGARRAASPQAGPIGAQAKSKIDAGEESFATDGAPIFTDELNSLL
jgi:hypothetical protein